ncbi:NAD-dependent epimerase/dehydratase family protein [Pedobacter metabolipauper]|uniref:Nucleoside-diphosphate-sugar epimerase n=1 Tax=Pedobacter metabolipauper TaxID=425513 RepID=A0A4R6T0T1_9SPHI|nr:NAD(P)-dependent oxidoreductase [Pedobacter metabolipauper]TDQ11649.1 nucleoside-diphosphate-sugar epimerase [Pedobacter metabolipauper]
MSKKVLITGATGFVGYHLIKKAVESGLDVYAAVRLSSDVAHLKVFDIQYTDLDYSSVEALKIELEEKQYDYIIHAAGITKAKTKADYDKVNAGYTRNLAIAASTAAIKLQKFVFVSSLAALGPLSDLNKKINDDTVGHPVTNYGASKLLAERYLSEIENLPLIVIRPTAVYGPREKDIFILFKSISRGIEPHIGSFKQQLSFIYVTDLAEIIVKSLFSSIIKQSYNISDGQIYDRYILAYRIKQALNKKTLKFNLPISLVGALASVMDLLYTKSKSTPTLNKEKMAELTAINWDCTIDHARKDLGFEPKYNLEQGIIETVRWSKKNHWL